MKRIIIPVLSFMIGSVASVPFVGAILDKRANKAQKYADKHLAIMLVMNQWLINKQEGKSLVSFFEENNYKSIAIYGMSYLGERLIDELKDSDIKVSYAIDKNADNIYTNVDVKRPDDELDKVDVVIVTAIFFFDEIEEQLKKVLKCPIISLEDII